MGGEVTDSDCGALSWRGSWCRGIDGLGVASMPAASINCIPCAILSLTDGEWVSGQHWSVRAIVQLFPDQAWAPYLHIHHQSYEDFLASITLA